MDQSDRDDERLLAGAAADGDGGGDGGLGVGGVDRVLGETGEAAVGLRLLDGDAGGRGHHLQDGVYREAQENDEMKNNQ